MTVSYTAKMNKGYIAKLREKLNDGVRNFADKIDSSYMLGEILTADLKKLAPVAVIGAATVLPGCYTRLAAGGELRNPAGGAEQVFHDRYSFGVNGAVGNERSGLEVNVGASLGNSREHRRVGQYSAVVELEEDFNAGLNVRKYLFAPTRVTKSKIIAKAPAYVESDKLKTLNNQYDIYLERKTEAENEIAILTAEKKLSAEQSKTLNTRLGELDKLGGEIANDILAERFKDVNARLLGVIESQGKKIRGYATGDGELGPDSELRIVTPAVEVETKSRRHDRLWNLFVQGGPRIRKQRGSINIMGLDYRTDIEGATQAGFGLDFGATWGNLRNGWGIEAKVGVETWPDSDNEENTWNTGLYIWLSK